MDIDIDMDIDIGNSKCITSRIKRPAEVVVLIEELVRSAVNERVCILHAVVNKERGLV